MVRPAQLSVVVLALFACASGPSDQAGQSSETAPLLEVRLVHEEHAAGLERVEFEDDVLYLEPRAVISDPDFEAVRPFMREGQLLLDMELKPEAAGRLTRVTGDNIGKRMALLVEARVLAAPVIRGTIGERSQAALELSRIEAERIAQRVRARWPDGRE